MQGGHTLWGQSIFIFLGIWWYCILSPMDSEDTLLLGGQMTNYYFKGARLKSALGSAGGAPALCIECLIAVGYPTRATSVCTTGELPGACTRTPNMPMLGEHCAQASAPQKNALVQTSILRGRHGCRCRTQLCRHCPCLTAFGRPTRATSVCTTGGLPGPPIRTLNMPMIGEHCAQASGQ